MRVVVKLLPVVSKAQQRILDYLEAHEAEGYVVVPKGVCGDIRSFDKLVSLGLISEEYRPYPSPPGSFASYYRLSPSFYLLFPDVSVPVAREP